MDEYRGGFRYQKEICQNCKFCVPLNIMKRDVEEVGSNGVIHAIQVSKSNTKYQEVLCCTALHTDDVMAPIYETEADNRCEKFERKYIEHVYDIDNSSMYDVHMVEYEFFPKFNREKYNEIYNERKALKEMKEE